MFNFVKHIFSKIKDFFFSKKEEEILEITRPDLIEERQGEIVTQLPFVEEKVEKPLPPAPPPVEIKEIPVAKEKDVQIELIPVAKKEIKIIEIDFPSQEEKKKSYFNKTIVKRKHLGYLCINGVKVKLPDSIHDKYEEYIRTGNTKELSKFIQQFLKGGF